MCNLNLHIRVYGVVLKVLHNCMGTKSIQTDADSNIQYLLPGEGWVPIKIACTYSWWGSGEGSSQESSLSGYKAPRKWLPMLSLSI